MGAKDKVKQANWPLDSSLLEGSKTCYAKQMILLTTLLKVGATEPLILILLHHVLPQLNRENIFENTRVRAYMHG